MATEHNLCGSTKTDYSSDLIKQATARYHYQSEFVAAMGADVPPDVASRERELLSALKDKLASVTAVHAGLLALNSNRPVLR